MVLPTTPEIILYNSRQVQVSGKLFWVGGVQKQCWEKRGVQWPGTW